MKMSSRTAVFMSALVTIAGASFGQNQHSTAGAGNYNFYITTPQTGERITGGSAAETVSTTVHKHTTQVASAVQATNATSAARQAQTDSTGQPVNLYIPQQESRLPAVASTSARDQASGVASQPARPARARAGENFYTGSNRGYTIQQVSNPAPSLASRSASSRLSSQRNSSVVATSARQSNYYSQSRPQQNPAYVSNATAPAQKQGFFSRLMHPHSASQQQQASRVQQPRQARTPRQSDSLLARMKPSSLAGKVQEGVASWYGSDWHGKKTANGERYDMNSMTAAHKSLPFGTLVKVTNERNGRECVVRINNRGPFSKGRILDLSKAAAGKLGMISSGVAKVSCEVIGRS